MSQIWDYDYKKSKSLIFVTLRVTIYKNKGNLYNDKEL